MSLTRDGQSETRDAKRQQAGQSAPAKSSLSKQAPEISSLEQQPDARDTTNESAQVIHIVHHELGYHLLCALLIMHDPAPLVMCVMLLFGRSCQHSGKAGTRHRLLPCGISHHAVVTILLCQYEFSNIMNLRPAPPSAKIQAWCCVLVVGPVKSTLAPDRWRPVTSGRSHPEFLSLFMGSVRIMQHHASVRVSFKNNVRHQAQHQPSHPDCHRSAICHEATISPVLLQIYATFTLQ